MNESELLADIILNGSTIFRPEWFGPMIRVIETTLGKEHPAVQKAWTDYAQTKKLIRAYPTETCHVCGKDGFSRDDLSARNGEFLGWCIACDAKGGFNPDLVKDQLRTT